MGIGVVFVGMVVKMVCFVGDGGLMVNVGEFVMVV